MKDLDKNQHDFEDGLRESFDDAELEPSEDVWLKVDNVLANQESSVFKRKVIYYRYVAAISLLLLFSLGVYTYLSSYNHEKNNVYSDNNVQEKNENEGAKLKPQESELDEKNIADTHLDGVGTNGVEDIDALNSKDSERNNKILNRPNNLALVDSLNDSGGGASYNSKNRGQIAQKAHTIESNKSNSLKNGTPSEKVGGEMLFDESKSLANTHTNNGKQDEESSTSSGLIQNDIFNDESISLRKENYVLLEKESPSEYQVLKTNRKDFNIEVYKVADRSLAKKPKKSSNDFYAGINVTPQFFDPNIQMNSGSAAVSNVANFQNVGVDPSNDEQNLQPEISYSYGLSFGMKLGKRWVLHSGLQYAKNNTSGTTNSYLQASSSNRYLAVPATLAADNSKEVHDADALRAFSPIYNTHEIDFNNNFEFASIPIKAGFILIDKKIAVVLSTGIATDLFLKNEIEDQDNNFDKTSIKPGSNSPYRSVYFNGLAGSEIIYKLGTHYSFSLEPSYRVALSSFSKSSSLITSHPQSFGIAAGFRYIFK